MSERLLVSTRKGLFVFRKDGDSWSMQPPHFLGDAVTVAYAEPGTPVVFAALKLGHFGVKLRRTTDNGKTWVEAGVPAYPPKPESENDTHPWSVQQIWSLEGGHGALWAGTIPGGLFRSPDGGDTWQLVESLWNLPERREWMGGGYDQPGIHSVCLDPGNARRLVLGVSTGGAWQTNDAGASWQLCAKGMRAAYMPPSKQFEENAQDIHRLVQCRAAPQVFWAQHHNGIFRSTDNAKSWREIRAHPSSFGFAVAAAPNDPDTAWFVPAMKDEQRVPVDGKLVVTRTRDGGQTFESFNAGLPSPPAYDLVYRHGLDVDAAGEWLAMGSTTGGLWVSQTQGESWQCLSTHLPPIYAVRFG
jgi:hypothetical protein